MAKHYIIKLLQKVFTTAEGQAPQVLVMADGGLAREMTRLLVECCQLPDLIMISTALDAFYDIYSENNYNEALRESEVIQ